MNRVQSCYNGVLLIYLFPTVKGYIYFYLLFVYVIIFTLLRKNMGNSQFQIPERVRKEWSESYSSDKRLFYNKVTEESFYFHILANQESKSRVPELIQRSIYPIPKTPKIIILNDKQGLISYLVQRKTLTLKAILSALFLQLQLLQTIKEIITTVYKLYQRYGPFGIKEGMIGGSSNRDIILWINEAYQSCQPSMKIPYSSLVEQTMLKQLLKIIKSNIEANLPQDIMINPPSSFQQAIRIIDQGILFQKSKLFRRKEAENKKQFLPVRYFSPRTTLKNDKNYIISQQAIQKPQQNKRKYNIPNFIKTIKEKKIQNQCQQMPKKVHHGLVKKQFLNHSCKFIRKQLKDSSKKNVSLSKIRSQNLSPSSNVKYLNKQKYNGSGSTNFSSISKKYFNQFNQNLTFSKKSFRDCQKPKRHTYPIQKISFPQRTNNYNKTKLEQLNLSSNEAVKPNVKQNEAKFSQGLHAFCKTLHESQQLNESIQIFVQEAQQKEYKVTVHDELHYSMSFKRPTNTNMIEQFSKIIY